MVNDVLKLNREDRAHREVFLIGEYLAIFIDQFCQIERVPASLIVLELTEDVPVSFDRSHLNQVMWNLCRNALRHCRGKTGSVTIIAQRVRASRVVKLDVIDDGPGIAPEVRGGLFEPFVTATAGGTGLGLYIARELCVANGATLDYVESSAGAQFTLTCRAAG